MNNNFINSENSKAIARQVSSRIYRSQIARHASSKI